MDVCPDGFSAITSWSECDMASDALGYTSDSSKNDGASNAVCNWCQGCGGQTTRLSAQHGKAAYWVCQTQCGEWQRVGSSKHVCAEDNTGALCFAASMECRVPHCRSTLRRCSSCVLAESVCPHCGLVRTQLVHPSVWSVRACSVCVGRGWQGPMPRRLLSYCCVERVLPRCQCTGIHSGREQE